MTGAALGVITFLQAPSVMTLLNELTHPVTTAIPHLVMFWITAILTLVICQRGLIVQIVPLLLSVLMTRLIEEQDGFDSLRVRENLIDVEKQA